MYFQTERTCFDLERDFIELKEIAEDDSWFSDNCGAVVVHACDFGKKITGYEVKWDVK